MAKKTKRTKALAVRAAGRPQDVSVYTATEGRDILFNSPDGWEVDQPYLWWLGNDDGTGTWGNPPPGADAADWWLSIPAVTRSVELICETIGGLPWEVHRFRDVADTDILSAADVLPAPDWIIDPQGHRTDGRIMAATTIEATLSGVDFWTSVLTSALLWGDGYVYVPNRATDGSPRPPLYQLHPDDVAIADGRYYAGDVAFASGSIIHLRGKPPYWGGHGQGVLRRHVVDLGLALTIRAYTAGQYRSGVPSGYLQSTQPFMDETEAQKLKDTWMRQHGRRRSIAVLTATTSFTPVAVTPIDAALDQARRWSTIDVANMFGVPAYMLGDVGTTGNTYSNAESRAIDFVTYTLRPWIRRLESTLSAELPRGTALVIDVAPTERADTATRNATLAAQLAAGVITVDEYRRLINYPTGPAAPLPPGPTNGGAPGA